jgi:vacuolar-type H+-ATPase subunit D/Vma8
MADIKRIRIFLQDQELAAVARAKVAKSKHRPEKTQEIFS